MPRKPGTIIEETLRSRLLRRHFAVSRYEVLLDLGCGTRPYRRFYEAVCGKTIGADMPGDYFLQSDVDLYCTADAIPLADESIDGILLAEVIHDIAEPGRMMKELARVTRPGATLIITSPFMVPICDGTLDHYRYTQHGLSHLLTTHGFHVSEIQPVGGVVASAIQLSLRPCLRFWSYAARGLRAPFLYTQLNPFMLLFVYLPQWLYLAWYYITLRSELLSRLRMKFDYGCIGYVTIARKS